LKVDELVRQVLTPKARVRVPRFFFEEVERLNAEIISRTPKAQRHFAAVWRPQRLHRDLSAKTHNARLVELDLTAAAYFIDRVPSWLERWASAGMAGGAFARTAKRLAKELLQAFQGQQENDSRANPRTDEKIDDLCQRNTLRREHQK
jgi:hypothetical protein